MEDALFKVPKNIFAGSSVFATTFTLPPGENDVEGTESKPFVLHGISEVDFNAFLKLMCSSPVWVNGPSKKFTLTLNYVISKHDPQIKPPRVDLCPEIMHPVGVHRCPGKGNTRVDKI